MRDVRANLRGAAFLGLGVLAVAASCGCGRTGAGDEDADAICYDCDWIGEADDARDDGRDEVPGDGRDDTPSACGDGVIDPDEECDDGALNSDTRRDACRTDCREAHCGDAVLDSGEACDDGNLVDTDGCRNTCALPHCGDGVLDPGEECDDGALNSDRRPDACRTACMRPWCGDGVVDAGEECDDGNRIDTDACDNACRPGGSCGDGVVDSGEECDDGEANSDTEPDACRTDCLLPICGDCVTDGGEACDDCNTVETDGCTTACSISTSCGDGVVLPPEECDDGNYDDTDACLSSCLDAFCGDGFVRTGVEECDTAVDYDGVCDTPCGSVGWLDCVDGCAFLCNPPPETCNGADDDCVGGPDSGFPCVLGAVTSCVTSCGTAGTGTCGATCDLPSGSECAPPSETCNGLDDDCAGGCDDGFPCCAGTTVPCTTACGTVGAGICGASCALPAGSECAGPAEACNGADDDCDGLSDEDFACLRGSTVACATTCGSIGSGTCTSSCGIPTGSACTPPAEVCNGADDDCVGGPDDGFACVGGSTQVCSIGSCGGAQTCDATSCTWRPCDFGAPPANDACGGAIPDVSAGGTFTGTTCAAVNDLTASCGGTASSPDVLFSLVLTSAADVTLDTVGTDFDAVLHVRGGATCPGTTEVACDDNAAGGTPGQARILRNLGAGTYWVVVDGAGAGNRGRFVLNVAVTATPPPPNDTCATAIGIGAGGVFPGTTAGAADDHSYTCAPSASGGRDVWYAFTLTEREIVYLDTVDGNTWDTVLQLRQGTCASATPVACADDQCRSYSGSYRSQIVQILDPGTYFAIVDGWNASSWGRFSLRFQHAPCAVATQITGNGSYDGSTVGQGNDSGGSCGGSAAADRMYYFGLCGARSLTATTCSSRTVFDTILYFASGGCGGSSEAACNDNSTSCSVNPLFSTVNATLPQGLNFLVVDGFFSAEGDYRVTISGM